MNHCMCESLCNLLCSSLQLLSIAVNRLQELETDAKKTGMVWNKLEETVRNRVRRKEWPVHHGFRQVSMNRYYPFNPCRYVDVIYCTS